MATGATYLNSNVSLISNASIRYEGTLFSINPTEATITLSNVRSYGTEDRKVDKFLGPKDTLFEYIIFKANDIKELIVDEPFNDPAIVTATAQQRPNSTNNSSNYGSGFNDNSNLQANGQSSSDQQNVSINQASAPSVSSAGQNAGRSENSTPEHTSASESSKQQKHDSNKSIRQQNSHQSNRQQQQHQNNQRRGWENNNNRNVNNKYHQQQNYQRYDRNRNNNNYYQNNNQVRRGQYQNNQNYQNQRTQYYRGNNNYRQDQNRGGFRTNSSYYNNQRYNKNIRRYNNEGEKLKGFDDFDFETANNKFIEDMTNGLGNLTISNGERSTNEDNDTTAVTNNSTLDKEVEDGDFYNKAKSFFDNISCEAIERSKGGQQKFDWKKEKSLNAETFGFKITIRKGPEGKVRQPVFFNEGQNPRFVNRRHYNNPHQNRQYQSRVNSS